VIHGENDLLVAPSYARAFAERTRAGHHDFDLYQSVRANAISIAVERFITRSG
jgi:hypothetical protein